MKHTHLPALLVAAALALASCGGGDDQAAEETSTQSAEQGVPAQADSQRGEQRRAKRQRSSSNRTQNGDGGSSAADAERAAREQRKPPQSGSPSGGGGKPKPAAAKTPAQLIASLSPAERRRLHKDLFEQGKRFCYFYGPEEVARSNNLSSTDPATVARLYATIYEQATPSLILPYQQGCLVGFERFARNPPKN